MTANHHYEYRDYKRHREAGLSHDAAIRAARADNVWRWRAANAPLINAGRLRAYLDKTQMAAA